MWFHFFSFRFLGVELENETKREESRRDPSSRGGGGVRMFDCVSDAGCRGPRVLLPSS